MGNVSRKGIHQGDLYTEINALKTAFNTILTKLDSDTGVTDVNYSSLYAIVLGAVPYSVSAGTGLSQADVYEFLNDYVTDYNAVIAKLNADAGVGDTDYATLTDNAGLGKAIQPTGMAQTRLITELQTYDDAIATLIAKLNADSGVGDTDYADVTDYVDDSGV